MKSPGIRMGALTGALLTPALIGILYFASRLAGAPYPPYDLFDWIARELPGPVITFGIDRMIDVLRIVGLSVADAAKPAEKMIAILQFFMIGTISGAAFFAFFRFRKSMPDRSTGLAVGAIVGLPLTVVAVLISDSDAGPISSVFWLMSAFAVWGMTHRSVFNRFAKPDPVVDESETPDPAVVSSSISPPQPIDRRQFLVKVGAATATITVATSGLGYLLATAARRELDAALAASVVNAEQVGANPLMPHPDGAFVPAPGTRPEYTAIEDHYKIFLRSEPTVIDGATWTLPITGLVENPMSLSIDNIRDNYEARDQIVTLACISNLLGGDLISTTRWTGARIRDILADAKPTAGAKYLNFTCGDGFHETVQLDLIDHEERIMLAYAWDGRPIPIDHGFPLRIWIPDLYGMKQPKWITGIEVVDEYKRGYWVERGWDEVARINATSVVDAVDVSAVYELDSDQMVPIGGIAFAGARGISKVEVRINGGPWLEAQIKEPLSETAWVLWRYDWAFAPGLHNFEVRAFEGDGTPQIEESRGNRPSGATGIYNRWLTL